LNLLVTINADETSTLPRPITSQYYLDHLAHPDEILVQVTEQDFDQALAELIPSVSAQELDHYKQVQKMFNSDDFAKEAIATAAAEAEKKQARLASREKQQEEQELAEALRKVEEAQRLLSSEGGEVTHHQEGFSEPEHIEAPVSKGKGKGRAVEYSHIDEYVATMEETSEGGSGSSNGLEEPLKVSQQDQETIEETQKHQNGGKSSNHKGKGKGKGRK